MWTLIGVVLSIIGLIVLGFKRRFDRFSQFKGISVLQLFFIKNIHHRITALRHEKLVCLNTPAFSAILATTPDSAKFILSDAESFPKAPRSVLASKKYLLFNKNILLTNGTQWRQYRDVLSPPFHFDAVKQWIPPFHQLTLELMQHWTPLVNSNSSIDIVRWMPLFTLDVLGTTVLSRSFDAMKGKEDKELAALSVLLQSAVRPSVMILGILEKLTGITMLKEVYSNIELLDKFFIDIINSRRNRKTTDGKFDLIDVMLSAHDPTWDDNELVSNAFVMFVAGHETTSTALTWLIYHLANNRPVQEKVIEEVQRVLNGKPVDQESLKELSYMNNVIKENMRMQPPVLMTATRVAADDVEYEGKVIPKGARVGVDIYAIHHSPEIWNNPEEFNPDRFNKPTVPFSYLPFSLKSRACLGNQFSLVEQAVFFATFMQHFKVDSINSFKPITGNHPAFNQPKELKVTLNKI